MHRSPASFDSSILAPAPKRAVAALVLGVLLAASGCGEEVPPSEVTRSAAALARCDHDPPPVIFDNDSDFDDTSTLAYLARLHKAGRIDLRLVTVTSAGAGLPGHSIRHARCLLERYGLPQIPVADSRAAGANAFPDILRFTFDAVHEGLLAGCTASEAPSAVPAEQAIVQTLEGSRQPVTVLVTGPMTNLAGAFRLAAGSHGRPLRTRIEHLYFQGGSLGASAGLCCGIVGFDDTQTLNVWADPGAAQAVLDALGPGQISLVGGEATQHVPIEPAFVARLATEAATPEANYVASVAGHPILAGAIAARLPVFWWDPLAAVAATRDGVVDFDTIRLKVIVDGPAAGRTQEVAPREHGARVRFGMSADQARFEGAFLDGLNGR
jgi:purine nucleosidase